MLQENVWLTNIKTQNWRLNENIRINCTVSLWIRGGVKREIDDLGYDISKTEDGRVTFIGDMEALCRANVFLRSAERILLKAGSFTARTFDELFECTKALPWEEWIPKDGKVWVTKASTVKSKLYSSSDIQSIMKKQS